MKRVEYHNLLDRSFDRYKKESFGFDSGTFPVYLGKEILKLITRGEWEKLKKQFDKFYESNNKS